jgi:hypothetical protein
MRLISQWLKRRGSYKKIVRNKQDYLERYYLLLLRPVFGLFYHIFHSDDPDKLHTHPWPWGRLIVKGHYREHYADGTYRDFGPGHIVLYRHPTMYHRIEILTPQVHTLFWRFQHWGEWGFLQDTGWRSTRETGEADLRGMRGVLFPWFERGA